MERSGQHCLGTKKGLSNSKEELAGHKPAHPPLEAGGRGQGGGKRGKPGPRDGIPHQTANRLPVSKQRLPEILDGWHPPRGSQLETSSPEHTQCMCTNWGWDRGGDKVHRTWGECACQAPGCLSCSGQGRHKRQAKPSLHFWGIPENWNGTQLWARSL